VPGGNTGIAFSVHLDERQSGHAANVFVSRIGVFQESEITMATRPQEADDELVDVFDTQQESEAMVVHSLLESAGIESIITNLDAPQDILPGVGGVLIRVNPKQADEARRIIEEYKNTAAAEGEDEEDLDDPDAQE
jgi:hypothetical protein